MDVSAQNIQSIERFSNLNLPYPLNLHFLAVSLILSPFKKWSFLQLLHSKQYILIGGEFLSSPIIFLFGDLSSSPWPIDLLMVHIKTLRLEHTWQVPSWRDRNQKVGKYAIIRCYRKGCESVILDNGQSDRPTCYGFMVNVSNRGTKPPRSPPSQRNL